MTSTTDTSRLTPLFDCDGVLVDSERIEAVVMAEALSWIGVAERTDEIRAATLGGSFAKVFAHIETVSGVELPPEFPDDYRALQLEKLADVSIVPGVEDMLDQLDRPWAVASGGPMVKMEITLNATGLWDRFAPHIYSCYDVGDHKPAPDVYLHAAEQLGTVPTRCVVVEDSENGVRAGASAGMFVVGLARDIDAATLLAAGASTTVGQLDEVPALVAELDQRLAG